MRVSFTYNKEKDAKCILSVGKGSLNSSAPTKQYEMLIATYGENPSPEQVGLFIDEYIKEQNIDISACVENFQKDWDAVSSQFQKRAESVFGISLSHDITAHPTINDRCPYSIKENLFFVRLQTKSPTKIAFHELWHFYTWYCFGEDCEKTLGYQKYNDLKESLTVLLNVECKDLLPEGVVDIGYPQHKNIREAILAFWEKNKDVHALWDYLVRAEF